MVFLLLVQKAQYPGWVSLCILCIISGKRVLFSGCRNVVVIIQNTVHNLVMVLLLDHIFTFFIFFASTEILGNCPLLQ